MLKPHCELKGFLTMLLIIAIKMYFNKRINRGILFPKKALCRTKIALKTDVKRVTSIRGYQELNA